MSRDSVRKHLADSNFRITWGFDPNDLEGAVWVLAAEQGKLPEKEEKTVFGCSICDAWFAPEELEVYQIWRLCGDDFREHIKSAHPELPMRKWPSIIKKLQP